VWGKLLPATRSLALGGLPLGLAHNVKVLRPVKQGQSLTWDDVAMDTSSSAHVIRREMERSFGGAPALTSGAARPDAPNHQRDSVALSGR
jgi:predicted homoserine dehydrogenase-like protein